MAQRRGTKDALNVRQQNAITGILELLQGKRRGSVAQVFRDAGYAPSSAANWTNLMSSLRPHLQPQLDWLELHRAQIMKEMDRKVGSADYADLTRALKMVTEAHQLLGGKPTQRVALSSEDRQHIDDVLSINDDEADEGED